MSADRTIAMSSPDPGGRMPPYSCRKRSMRTLTLRRAGLSHRIPLLSEPGRAVPADRPASDQAAVTAPLQPRVDHSCDVSGGVIGNRVLSGNRAQRWKPEPAALSQVPKEQRQYSRSEAHDLTVRSMLHQLQRRRNVRGLGRPRLNKFLKRHPQTVINIVVRNFRDLLFSRFPNAR